MSNSTAVRAAILSRLADLYMSLPEHVSAVDASGEAMSQLITELAEEITNHAPALAFRLVQQENRGD